MMTKERKPPKRGRGRPSVRPSGESAHISIRVDVGLLKQFKELCSQLNISPNDLLERYIQNFVTRKS